MPRYLTENIREYIGRKIVLLSGPRQVGKTHLSRSLVDEATYLNYDEVGQRQIISKKQWLRDTPLLVLDEIHKMPHWKRWLKGIYDTEGLKPPILVTGSARLDVTKKMGDSLAGRQFSYRLHPFDLKELFNGRLNILEKNKVDISSAFKRIIDHGGFPEPYLESDAAFTLQWQRSHLSLVLRQDLLDLEQVTQISKLELLVELLRSRVGSPTSFASLARDLEVSIPTTKRWLTILENLFIIFAIFPWHKNVARSILKTPKYYFYDTGQVKGALGTRFENLVACALLKELHLREDTQGESWRLYYLRDRNGHEIDFFLYNEQEARALLIEAKSEDERPDSNFRTFESLVETLKIKAYQLVPYLQTSRQVGNKLVITNALSWLRDMNWD